MDRHHSEMQGNIIAVTDNLFDLRLLTEILTENGHKVSSHTKGESALLQAHDEPPDLVLLDIDSPQLDGYEVCRQLKTGKRTKHIPVIFIIPAQELFNRAQLFAMGGADYITKPFQAEETLTKVETHLSVHKMRQKLEDQGFLLQQEIDVREQVETELKQHREQVDALVEARTTELKATNEQLLQEITELKQTEENLRLTRFTVEHISDALFWVDPNARIVDVNEAACHMHGYTREELTQMSIQDFDDAPPFDVQPGFAEHLRKTGTVKFETRHRTKDGRLIPVEIVANMIKFGDQEFNCCFVRDITDRKQADLALQASEEKFRVLVENSPDMIMTVDRDGTILFINRTAPGLKMDDVLGTDSFLYLPPEHHKRYRQALELAFELGESDYFEHVAGGLWLESRITPIKENEKTIAAMSISTDITERKKAEEALQKSEEKYRLLIESAQDPIFTSDIDGRYLFVNMAAASLFGTTPDKIIGKSAHDLFPVHIADEYRENVRQVFQTGNGMIAEAESEINGQPYWFSTNMQPIQDQNDNIKEVQAVVRDITDLKKAEEALRKSEERLQQAIRVSNIGIYDHDHLTDTIYWSPEQRKNYGWAPDEPVTLSKFLQQVYSEDRERIGEAVRRAHDPTGNGLFDVEHRIVHRDGTIRWLSTRSQTFFGGEGNARRPIRTVGAVLDVTESKLTEAALRQSEARLEEAQRIAHVGSWEWVAETDTPTWSKELCAILDVDPDKPVPTVAEQYNIYTPESMERMNAAIENAMQLGIPYEIELERVREDGTRKWLQARGERWLDEEGKLIGLRGTALDITESKFAEKARAKLEEQLRQAQKMESIGRLAGGIAHDFNNLLVPIIGYADLCLVRMTPDSKSFAAVEKIKKAAERAASLTRQLLAFSRRQVLEVQVFNLNKVVTEFQDMLQRLITEDIEVQTFLAPTPCMLKADRTQIEQLLLNLSVNANDAMPNGGKLIIETDTVYLDEAYAQTHSDTRPGHYVMLSFSDTGHGMDIETQKHIFEPFFTTKEQGKGTGLGLATVFGIVKQHKGNIWMYSEPGKGTTFKVYLPQAEETTQLVAPTIPDPPSVYGTETVLIVEDDPMVRKLVCETLEAYGYTIIESESPDKGFQLALAHKDVVHLLLTDVIMPGMNGRELFEKLTAVQPNIKVLYMSGYTDNVIIHHGVLDEGINFLQKPFTIRDLTQKVRTVLN